MNPEGHHSRPKRRDRRVVRLEDFTQDEMALIAGADRGRASARR
jgi:hypothetical protein